MPDRRFPRDPFRRPADDWWPPAGTVSVVDVTVADHRHGRLGLAELRVSVRLLELPDRPMWCAELDVDLGLALGDPDAMSGAIGAQVRAAAEADRWRRPLAKALAPIDWREAVRILADYARERVERGPAIAEGRLP